MPYKFRVDWLRENGRDAGTIWGPDQLPPEIKSRILELAGEECGELSLRLPYMDRREWRKRGEILASLQWKRFGHCIEPVLPPGAALRSAAATLALSDPAWMHLPLPPDPRYGLIWRDISAALQRGFRDWISTAYFADLNRFGDRESAYPMIVYQAARLSYGHSRGVFAYELRDFPECDSTLEQATKMTGRAVQALLAPIERRLTEAGLPELAHRYAPVWYEDILKAVRAKPRPFINLIAAESAFIDALVELGMNPSPGGVHRFAKIANQALRKVYGMDVRHLGLRALQEANRVLAPHAASYAVPLPPLAPHRDSAAL